MKLGWFMGLCTINKSYNDTLSVVLYVQSLKCVAITERVHGNRKCLKTDAGENDLLTFPGSHTVSQA